jgi:molecular chaperone DnaK (HSP70)
MLAREQVVDAVVGVPVYFNDAQRHAMLDACKIAGINCLR